MVRPVPIPNTAVKHSIADGSSPIGSARVGSRQSLSKRRNESFGVLFMISERPKDYLGEPYAGW